MKTSLDIIIVNGQKLSPDSCFFNSATSSELYRFSFFDPPPIRRKFQSTSALGSPLFYKDYSICNPWGILAKISWKFFEDRLKFFCYFPTVVSG